jgi:hypothetical protein
MLNVNYLLNQNQGATGTTCTASNIVTMRKSFIKPVLLLLLAVPSYILHAQGYQALHGSAYTGGTAAFNNPASPVHSAYKWDLTLFATQVSLSNNASYFDRSDPNNIGLVFRDGNFSRFVHNNADANLFSFLYKINNRQAVNFSLRARSYNHAKTLPFNYVDSMVADLKSFLINNRTTQFLEGFTTSAGWLQGDLTYAQVLSENSESKFSAGITLQIMKNMVGGFAKISKISYLESKNGTDTSYTFTNGRGSFGYSASFEESDSFKEFMKRSSLSLGLSIGAEYLVYNSDKTGGLNNNINYDWKIGVSILDIGSHSYKASPYSRQMADPNPNITDGQLESKLSGAANMEDLSDSLATVFNGTSSITDKFSISHPTRLVLNIDKNLGSNFFVNGELNLNFHSTSSYNKLRTRELNLLTITPRWETIGFGAYLPIQYNTQGQLWVGAAVKLGPLVLGIHNLGWARKVTDISGGGYLLLSIHPFNTKKVLSKLDCL